jgi:endonuclease/exonuclease/phosphatase family metal-dependent hydrolase
VRFRFGTWNLGAKGFAPDRAELMRKAGCDLLALQEVREDVARDYAKSGGFDWVITPVVAGARGDVHPRPCAILGTRWTTGAAKRLVSLPFPDKALVVEVAVDEVGLTVGSFHVPPGSRDPAAKTATLRGIAKWATKQRERTVFGIDANAPKVDHWDATKCVWWRDGEEDLLGAKPAHKMQDALRRWYEANPAERAPAQRRAADGPLEVSYWRGTVAKKPCRYDHVFTTGDIRVESVRHWVAESQAVGADHVLVVAELAVG